MEFHFYIEFCLALGNGFIGEMSDFLVLREVDSIETVIHDLYTHRPRYNIPCDIVNSLYYGDRVLFYIHPLRYHHTTLVNPFMQLRLQAINKVTFYRFRSPIQTLSSLGGFTVLVDLLGHFISSRMESALLVLMFM